MTLLVKDVAKIATTDISTFLGQLHSFSSGLKLYHWHVTGVRSYAQHMALDQASESLLSITDRLVETSYAMLGDQEIVIPSTSRPNDIVKYAERFYETIQKSRTAFLEPFFQSILDDLQETVQQLLYRLKRLQ